MKKYTIYHIRWQISALVMMPIMIFLEQHLPLWQNLMIGQFVGALIFWNIDKWIFGRHNESVIDEEIEKLYQEEIL